MGIGTRRRHLPGATGSRGRPSAAGDARGGHPSGAADPRGRRREAAGSSRRRGGAAPYLLVAPAVALFIIFLLVPIGYTVWLSFRASRVTAGGLLRVERFVGWDNYADVLTSSDYVAGGAADARLRGHRGAGHARPGVAVRPAAGLAAGRLRALLPDRHLPAVRGPGVIA